MQNSACFVGTFQLQAIVIGSFHALLAVARVVRRQKQKPHLCPILPCCHRQREVSELASYEVQHEGRFITTDQSMCIDKSFYCWFSIDLRKDRCWEVREESLDADCCPLISSCTLVVIGGGFVSCYNSSNLSKAIYIITRCHTRVELNG